MYSLFAEEFDSNNLLPRDGEVFYKEQFLQDAEKKACLEELLQTVAWKPDEVMMFGKKLVTKREMAWYGDDGLNYKYSGISRKPLPWSDTLLKIKQLAEQACKVSFNSCLLNLYHDGNESMGWHSDDEPELGPNPVIASVSLGAERKFAFKHRKTGECISLVLKNGSLLLMQGVTQHFWVHTLRKSAGVKNPRVNLTFRRIT